MNTHKKDVDQVQYLIRVYKNQKAKQIAQMARREQQAISDIMLKMKTQIDLQVKHILQHYSISSPSLQAHSPNRPKHPQIDTKNISTGDYSTPSFQGSNRLQTNTSPLQVQEFIADIPQYQIAKSTEISAFQLEDSLSRRSQIRQKRMRFSTKLIKARVMGRKDGQVIGA